MANCTTCGKPIPNGETICPECERIVNKISINKQIKSSLSELVSRRINQLELESHPLIHLTTGVPNGYHLVCTYGILSARCFLKVENNLSYNQFEEALLREIDQKAVVAGANAIIGIRIDYTPIGQENSDIANRINGENFKSLGFTPILMLTITGTATKIEPIQTL